MNCCLPQRTRMVRGSAHARRGVALVVTLILLVVITTLAVAFLALTHRETAAVTGASATTDAEFAAEAALERAKAQIVASFQAANTNVPPVGDYRPNNVMGPDLLVSVASTNGTNRLAPVSLWRNSTPPVYIQTNRSDTTLEDRWYLDLNRNGRFEPTGYVVDVDDREQVILAPDGKPVVQWRIGDPQWIGVLRDPTQPHGEGNPYIARYAFLLLPVGRTLDANWIHNDTFDWSRAGFREGFTGFLRNQGVGSFEMNLAAFLADLNPVFWNPLASPYRYAFTNFNVRPNTGLAFTDALQLLTNRYYAGNKTNLATPLALFEMVGPPGNNYLPQDYVNMFADGPFVPLGSSQGTASVPDRDNALRPWPGADSHRHYFTPFDLLDGRRTPPPPPTSLDGGISNRLLVASAQTNSEDRYTYYRMLAQLGTDSPTEGSSKLDLNYVSVGGYRPTNMIPWTATNFVLGQKPSELFFSNAVDRLLTNEFFPYGITNVRLSRLPGQGIPVYTNRSIYIAGNSNNPPLYNARIHQLLQMSLNIYEATRTNDLREAWPMAPTVMRPIFERRGDDIFIVEYRDETGVDLRSSITNNWFVLDAPGLPSNLPVDAKFYDIPILFGARKGIPNFNEFTINTVTHFTRKLQVEKDRAGRNIATNQMFIMSVSNFFMVEALNAWSNFPNASLAYPRALEMRAGVVSSCQITNRGGVARTLALSTGYANAYPALSWTGGAYRLSATLTNITLPTSIYYEGAPLGPGFTLFNNYSAISNKFERISSSSINRWGMSLSNRLLYVLFERDTGRLVDCYSSARMNTRLDMSAELDRYGRSSASLFARMWDPQSGIENQIRTSSGGNGYGFLGGTEWIDYSEVRPFSTTRAGMEGFAAFLADTGTPTNYFHQAPFSPNVRLLQVSSWEANDPLVHGTVYDLYDTGTSSNSMTTRMIPRQPYSIFTNDLTTMISSLGRENKRYRPWGGRQGSALPEDLVVADTDPGLYYPDLWDFPSQMFPNVGWLGRVHRGTPWQTIYLKAADPGYTLEAWRNHTGAAFLRDTHPTNDWRLLDLFTVALHPNLTRGRLSINQTNPAAWAAVLSGVAVTEVNGDSSEGFAVAEVPVQPAASLALTAVTPRTAVTNPIGVVIAGINQTRNRLPGRQFTKLSEFMLVDTLTQQSPYLSNYNATADAVYRDRLTDSDYERIPQQILGLVKLGEPRYVLHAWGQSLKPAEYGVRLNGSVLQRNGVGVDMATKTPINYQITGEMATRAVVRVDFETDGLGRRRYDRPHVIVETFNILPTD